MMEPESSSSGRPRRCSTRASATAATTASAATSETPTCSGSDLELEPARYREVGNHVVVLGRVRAPGPATASSWTLPRPGFGGWSTARSRGAASTAIATRCRGRCRRAQRVDGASACNRTGTAVFRPRLSRARGRRPLRAEATTHEGFRPLLVLSHLWRRPRPDGASAALKRFLAGAGAGVRGRAVRARRGHRRRANLIGLFAVPPFVAAFGAGRPRDRRGGRAGRRAGADQRRPDDFFGSFDHLMKRRCRDGTLPGGARAASEVRAELSRSWTARSHGRSPRRPGPCRGARPGGRREALGWDAAALWEVDAGDTLRCTATGRPPKTAPEVPRVRGRASARLRHRASRARLASGEPAWIDDLRRTRTPGAPPRKRSASDRSASFPIMGDRGTSGVVDLFSRRRKPVDSGLMKGMATAGRYIGQHLYRRRIEEAVRRAEELRGAVLESALDCVITMNHEGRMVEFNPAAEHTFGHRRTDAVGQQVARPDPRRCATARARPRALSRDRREQDPRPAPGADRAALGRHASSRRGLDRAHRRRGAADVRRVSARRSERARAVASSTRRLAGNRRALQRRGRRRRVGRPDPVVEPRRGALYGWSAEEALGMSIADTAPPDRIDEANYLVRQLVEGRAITNHRTVRSERTAARRRRPHPLTDP